MSGWPGHTRPPGIFFLKREEGGGGKNKRVEWGAKGTKETKETKGTKETKETKGVKGAMERWSDGRIRNRIVLIYFLCVQFDNIYNQNLKEEIALVKSAWTYS